MKKVMILTIFFLGLAMVIFPHIAKPVNKYIQKSQAETFYELEIPEEELTKVINRSKECNDEIFENTEGFRDPFALNGEEYEQFKDCFALFDGEIFAAIDIPKLGLVIPIYLGATDYILSKGIGQVEGSSLPIGGKNTHTVLAGHRGMPLKAMFRDLDELHEGDIFYIHTLEGTLTYEVYKQRVIYPHETESLEIVPDKDLATLLTCHPYRYNYQRLLIHAERID